MSDITNPTWTSSGGSKDWAASRLIIGTYTEPTYQNNASGCTIFPRYNPNSHNTSGTNPTSASTYDANGKLTSFR